MNNSFVSDVKGAYKRITGKELIIQDLVKELDSLIEKVKAAYSLVNDLIDVLLGIKRGLHGMDFNLSDKKIRKAIEIIEHIVTLSDMPEKEKEAFVFWMGMLKSFMENRKKGNRSSWR